MFDRSLGERDGPVWVVVTYGGRDEESAWQLRVDGNLLTGIELGDEFPLDLGICDDVVVDVLRQLVAGVGEVLLGLILRENRCVKPVFERIVGQVLDDRGCLLLVDEPGGLGDELLRIEPELGERLRGDSAEDCRRSTTGELSFLAISPRRSYLTWDAADTVAVWVAVLDTSNPAPLVRSSASRASRCVPAWTTYCIAATLRCLSSA